MTSGKNSEIRIYGEKKRLQNPFCSIALCYSVVPVSAWMARASAHLHRRHRRREKGSVRQARPSPSRDCKTYLLVRLICMREQHKQQMNSTTIIIRNRMPQASARRVERWSPFSTRRQQEAKIIYFYAARRLLSAGNVQAI